MADQGLIITPRLTRDPDEFSPNPTKPGHVVRTTPYKFETLDAITPVIRRSLVYWDRLDVPNMSGVMVNHISTPEMNELASAGVLSRRQIIKPPDTLFHRSDLASLILTAHWMTFEDAERREPGVWSLSLQGSAYAIPDAVSKPGRTIQVELSNSLPVPGDDVPFSAILEFKEKRKPELYAFRATMNDVYQKIISSPDPSHLLNSERNKIDNTVADIFKTMRESFVTRVAESMTVDLNAPQMAAIATSSVAAYNLAGVGGLVSSLLAGAVSLVKFRKGLGRVPSRISNRFGAFTYVYEVVDHLTSTHKPGRNDPCPCGGGKKFKKCHGR